MTKLGFTAVMLSIMLILTACSRGPATPAGAASRSSPVAAPPAVSIPPSALDLIDGNQIAQEISRWLRDTPAVYTTLGGFEGDVKLLAPEVDNLEILSREKGGNNEMIFICKADIIDPFWIGTTEFTIRYIQGATNLVAARPEFESIDVTPAYPLDFSSEDIYRFFEDEDFFYWPYLGASSMSGRRTPVNKDTLVRVEMVEALPISQVRHIPEEYIVELHLVTGDILEGMIGVHYIPTGDRAELDWLLERDVSELWSGSRMLGGLRGEASFVKIN
jgi:hypothetical protein